jgi:hypothetical protein
MLAARTVPSPAYAEKRVALSSGSLLFLGGLLPGFYEFGRPGVFGFGRGFEMAAIARSLVATGTFANPFEPHLTGLTASNPPLYPIILAALLKAFGPLGAVAVAVLLNILLNAAIGAMLPRVSTVLFGRRLPGIFAGIFWIFTMRLMPQWDTTCTVAGLVLLCIVTARDLRTGRSGARGGLLAGAVSLLNPGAILVALPSVAYLTLRERGWSRAALRYCSVIVVAVGLCNLPWLARNYAIWHAPVLRTNFGYTFYCSNNDCARSSFYATARVGCYQQTHPSASLAEIRLLETLGEAKYDRLRLADALHWIGAHPARFRQLTLARVVDFWFPDPGISWRTAYAVWFVTALSIPGLLLMALRREPVTIYLVAVWLLYPLMFYVVVSDERYRLPLLWTSLLAAGYLAEHLSARHTTRQED